MSLPMQLCRKIVYVVTYSSDSISPIEIYFERLYWCWIFGCFFFLISLFSFQTSPETIIISLAMQPAYTPEGTESNSSTPTDNPLQIQLSPSRAALLCHRDPQMDRRWKLKCWKTFFLMRGKGETFFGDGIIFIHPLNQNRKAKF